MASHKRVGPHCYSYCPICGGAIAFFKAEQDSFPGGEVALPIDGIVTLECRGHGKFEVPVRDLHFEDCAGSR
jgi:hypothetical protein